MKRDSVYNELAIDLVSNCGLNMFTANKIVDFLSKEGLVYYDTLKEHYGEQDEV